MTDTNLFKQALYPFSEMFQVDTSSTDAVTFWNIPAGTIITMVLAKINVAGTGSGNLIVGDEDDDNGFILACDATSTADTVFGDITNERGAYLNAAVPTAGGADEPKWKVYTATKAAKIDCSGALTTEATIDIMVFGYRYNE